MTLDATMRRRLQSERRARLRQGFDALAAGDIDGARRHWEWIELADKLLATGEGRRTRRGAVAVGAACLLVALLLMTVRIRRTTVVVEVAADGVALTLGEDSVLFESVPAEGFALSGLAAASLDGSQLVVDQGEIAGGRASLRRLVVPPGAALELERGLTGLAVFARDRSAAGAITLRRSTLEVGGERRVIDLAETVPPATLAFNGPAGLQVAEPLGVRLVRPGAWRLAGRGARSVRFETEDPPGSGRWRSTIQGGTLRILESGQTIELGRGDSLVLDVADGARVFAVTDSGDVLRVSFEAEVRRVRAGPPRFVSTRTPTIAQYLYRNERLALFWAAAGFLWGLLWSIRNTVLS